MPQLGRARRYPPCKYPQPGFGGSESHGRPGRARNQSRQARPNSTPSDSEPRHVQDFGPLDRHGSRSFLSSVAGRSGRSWGSLPLPASKQVNQCGWRQRRSNFYSTGPGAVRRESHGLPSSARHAHPSRAGRAQPISAELVPRGMGRHIDPRGVRRHRARGFSGVGAVQDRSVMRRPAVPRAFPLTQGVSFSAVLGKPLPSSFGV